MSRDVSHSDDGAIPHGDTPTGDDSSSVNKSHDDSGTVRRESKSTAQPADAAEDSTITPAPHIPMTMDLPPSGIDRFSQFPGYRILGELGQGGMGVVFLAHQVKLDRMVALKMLLGHSVPNSDATVRFLQEAKSVAALQHANIVQIFDLGELNGQPYFAMEYLEGGHLGQQIATREFHYREAAELVEKLARAVHYAHSHKVIHRDLKPSNILLTRDGVPKISDFGLAKIGEGSIDLTRTGAILGTPGYLSPEQAAGKTREVGITSDVFSLGVILYELLTGKRPFDGYSEMEIVRQVIDADPVSPGWHRPQIPRDLETICLKCLNKQQQCRYTTAAELADDLGRFLDGAPIKARRQNWSKRALYRMRRHPVQFMLWFLGAALAAAAAFGWWYADAYVWERRECYEHMVFGDTGPLGVGLITKRVAAQRHLNLEFTRVGRLGKVVQVRSINGHFVEPESGSMQRIFDGFFGNSYGSAPTRSTLQYDDHDRILIERSFDRWGYPLSESNYRYPRDLDPQSEWDVIIRFVAPNNQELRLPMAVALAKVKKDADGLDHIIMFANAYDQPRRNGDGVYGYQIEYYPNRYPKRIINLGAKGERIPNRYGFAEARFDVDRSYRSSRVHFYGVDGEPTVCRDGYHSLLIEFDEMGNPIRKTFQNEDKIAVATPGGIAVVETQFEFGNPVEMRILNEYARGHELFAETVNRCTFDGRGRKLEMVSLTNGHFDWLEENQYDGELVIEKKTWNDPMRQHMRFVERFVYDANRLLQARWIISEDPPLVVETSYQYDQFRRKTREELWLHTDNQRLRNYRGPHGCSQIITRYHENGFPSERRYSHFRESGLVRERIEQFDDQGRMKLISFVDEDSQPVDGPDGYSQIAVEYAENDVPVNVVFRNTRHAIVPIHVVVTKTGAGGRSSLAEIQVGDIIVAFNGNTIVSSFQLQYFLNFGPAAQSNRITLSRQGTRMEFAIPIQGLNSLEFRDQAIDN